MNEVAIPAGMLPYGPSHRNYPDAPVDWDGGPALFRDGTLAEYYADGWCWAHNESDPPQVRAVELVAYTPKPSMTTPSPEALVPVEQVDREAAAEWRLNAIDADMTVSDFADLVQTFARHRLAALETATDQGEVERLREVLSDLLAEVDDETCRHPDTHRGGAIWTVCSDCGAKWADDQGGFTPYRDTLAVAAAREALQPDTPQ